MARGDRSPRDEHADRTRNALLEAALNLFSANGYDETTTDQIAESAGVSPRTFFRYFPTKESVLFFGEYDFIDAVSGVYLAQPEEAVRLRGDGQLVRVACAGAQAHPQEESRSTTRRSRRRSVLLGPRTQEPRGQRRDRGQGDRRAASAADTRRRMPTAGVHRHAARRTRAQSVVGDAEPVGSTT